MREELDNKLCEKYPKIFADRNRPMTETCMCWGFECGDGWFNIIDQLCSNIQHHIDWKNRTEEKVAQVVAEQVKEKFGTLRFYVRGGDDYTNGLISMAESMSSVTCEECGNPGKTGGTGWVSTLCEEHRKK
jgi:hypothetical protein